MPPSNRIGAACLAFLLNLGSPTNVAAQDLVIINAWIIVGNGSVIESGTHAVRNGRIAGGEVVVDKR